MSAQEMRHASDRFTGRPRSQMTVVATTVAVDPAQGEMLGEMLRDDGIHVAAQATQVTDLEGVWPSHGPVVLVLAGGPSREAWRSQIAMALNRLPGARIVIVASLSTPLGVRKALEAGACGLVFTSQMETALAPTVRAVACDQVVLPEPMRSVAEHPALSFREKQVLGMAAQGYTNYQIGAELFLAESTVKSHLSSIFQKLRVHSRSEAAAMLADSRQNADLTLPEEHATAGGLGSPFGR
jgi:DNA-binding NarL/FixJ family response regulator